MKIIYDNSGLANFEAWDGTVETAQKIIEVGKLRNLTVLLKSCTRTALQPDSLTTFYGLIVSGA